MEDVLELVKSDEKIVCDGKRAYMPHPIFSRRFCCTGRAMASTEKESYDGE